MSRKAKRLRSRNRFFALRIKVLEMLRDKLRADYVRAESKAEARLSRIDQLQRELARWRPANAHYNAAQEVIELRVRLSKEDLLNAQYPVDFINTVLADARDQIVRHIRPATPANKELES